MLACLAIGSIVYYSLELLHTYLEREVIVEELESKVTALRRELEDARTLRAGSNASTKEGKKWYQLW